MAKSKNPTTPGKDAPSRLSPSQKDAVAAALALQKRLDLFAPPVKAKESESEQ